MTRGWSTNIHNPPYRAYLCIHPFIAATVLIIDFYCRPLQVQISWKSPSLHEVRAEEHEPEIMLRQDARRQTRQNSWHWLWLCTASCWQHMEAMAAGAFVCTCSWTCLEVSCTCCPSVWLGIAISIWRFYNPTTTPGATTRNSKKTLINNNAWSACIFSSCLLSSLDFTINLVTSIALHLHLVKHSHPCITTQFCSCWSWDSSNAWACKGLHLTW